MFLSSYSSDCFYRANDPRAAGNNSRRSRVVCRRSNLGRSAKANPNPAYPESNFESFERAVPRANRIPKEITTADEERRSEKGRGRRPRNPWLPQGADYSRRRRTGKDAKLSLVRGILAISARIVCSSWFRSRKLAREKRGKGEKRKERKIVGDFRPR